MNEFTAIHNDPCSKILATHIPNIPQPPIDSKFLIKSSPDQTRLDQIQTPETAPTRPQMLAVIFHG